MAAPGEVTFEQELSAKRRVIRKDGVDCHNECEMLSIVIEKAPGSSCSMSSYEKWWNRMNDDTGDGTEKKLRLIHMVPEMLRQKHSSNSYFDPLVVSIGPYHYGKSELQEVERLKDSMARQFIKECKKQFSAIYSEVEQISGDAREYYPEESVSKFDEKGFTRLMFVDGCFVLQFIDNFLNKRAVEHMKSNIAAFVRRDLMLLENQLPYIVLKKLMSLRFQGNDGDDLINNFITSFRGDLSPQTRCVRATFEFFDKCCSIFKDPWSICQEGTANRTDQLEPVQKPKNENQPLHLLDIFLTKYINTNDLMKLSYKRKHRDWYSYPAANELKTLGIHFRPSVGKQFTEIKFISTPFAGLLLLPQIMIDDTTKSMLLNLVAYETSPDAPDDLCGLTSYICFMDSLIDQAEDTKVLRSKGIVFNLLGSDQQASELFNAIAQDLVPNPYAFVVTKQGIEAHSRSRFKTWMAQLINTHFSSPWTGIAFLAATATISVTFLATWVSIKDYCSGEGRQEDPSFCAFF